MNAVDDRLKDLAEVRAMMEQSSRFQSISGLSGICAGIVALVGAVLGQLRLAYSPGGPFPSIQFLAVDALCVLVLALLSSIYFSSRAARKNNLPLWTAGTKLLAVDMSIPLLTGAALSAALWYQNQPLFIPPVTLIFYGLALVSARRFTVREVRWLGLSEILLGLASLLWTDAELFLWAFGFGFLHIIYGLLAYRKFSQ